VLDLIGLVKADYKKLRTQFRMKGAGHGSISRAFYAGKKLVGIILGRGV